MRYWVYLSGNYGGPYSVEELLRLDGFTAATMVCPEGEIEWFAASKAPSLKAQWAAQPLPLVTLPKETPTRGAVLESFLKGPPIVESGDFQASQARREPSIARRVAAGLSPTYERLNLKVAEPTAAARLPRPRPVRYWTPRRLLVLGLLLGAYPFGRWSLPILDRWQRNARTDIANRLESLSTSVRPAPRTVPALSADEPIVLPSPHRIRRSRAHRS